MNSSLWEWPELCRALHLPEISGPSVTGIGFDSRLIKPGDLFVALSGDPGTRFSVSSRSDRDGHNFLQSALDNGAVGALVAQDNKVAQGKDVSCPSLPVVDTLDGLWALGRAARARFTGQAVAITGSSGKTTSKEFLSAALNAFASSGSFNNHIGVPLTLAQTSKDTRFAVYEIGTNHPGEIAPLSQLVRPNVAVLLNVHNAHIEYFPSRVALIKEKISIYKGLEGISRFVINDEIDLSSVPEGVSPLTFGTTRAADIRLTEVVGDAATYQIAGEKYQGRIPGGGPHRALSLAAVLGVLISLDEDIEKGLNLPHRLVPEGRGNRQLVSGITLIDDSYNANPVSMKAALSSISEEAIAGRKYALLGDMLELGVDTQALHAELAQACEGFDGVLCVGEHMRALFDALPVAKRLAWSPKVEDINIKALVNAFSAGDFVLIKGSNRTFWASQFVARLVDLLER